LLQRIILKMANEDKTSEKEDEARHKPSVSVSVFLCWVVPVMLIAAASRFAVDTTPAAPQKPQSIPVNLFDETESKSPTSGPDTDWSETKTSAKTEGPSGMPTVLASKPSSYIEVVESIERRRLDWEDVSVDPVQSYERVQTTSSSPNPVTSSRRPDQTTDSSQPNDGKKPKPKTTDPPRGASTDPERMQFLQEISNLRRSYENQPDEISHAIALAEALRVFDVQYHDGGSAQKEAIETFHEAIEMARNTREEMVSRAMDTRPGEVDPVYGELLLYYSDRSIDGVLCALYTSLGKTYFMANMFEKYVQSILTLFLELIMSLTLFASSSTLQGSW
jgi:hypothetical protein